MGLSACAVTKYEIIESATDDQRDDFGYIHNHENFLKHLGSNLKNGMVVNKLETNGRYRSSYLNHSHFREFLASLVYPCVQIEKPSFSDPDFDEKNYQFHFPHLHGMYQKDNLSLCDDFVAIIHFSDCEGVIGNELCKVLDLSFDKYMDKASGSEWFEQYKRMAECVKFAAESGGYLSFH